MNLAKKLEQILESPARMKKVRSIFYATLVLLVVADFFAHRAHPIFPWDFIPGFSAVYGFVSCVLIIIVSKFIGHRGLMVRENFYDTPGQGAGADPHANGEHGGSAHHD